MLSFGLGVGLVASQGLSQQLVAIAQTTTQMAISSAASSEDGAVHSAQCPAIPDAQHYDVIVFGDEVPGVMTALKVQRELRQRGHSDRVAVITEGDTRRGLGGHLVRGGLAYLDRNQVPPALRSQYGTFGRPSLLYREFLRLGEVNTIALDRFIASRSFNRVLSHVDIDIVSNIRLGEVQTAGMFVCAFSTGDKIFSADQFIDASQSGELAAASGVEMMRGLEALGFPDSALSIGLVLDLYGVDIEQFKLMEATLIRRFLDPSDASAQRWLRAASGGDEEKRQYLLRSLLDFNGQPKLLYQGTADSADVRSLALSILVHGYLEQEYDIKSSGFLFDRANIAIFNDRLSFNALLFYADAETAKRISRNGDKPTPEMSAVAAEIATLFERIGVPRVEVMDELYVRNAGQIANPIDELSATLMAAGGIPVTEAIGTFGYHLDDRGGIDGLDERVGETVLRLFDFDQMPIFNYGFRHTLPREKHNLAVLGPASGFGGLGTTAGRIVEFNIGVGEGLAIAIAQSLSEERSLHTITNNNVRTALGYRPALYGYRTDSFRAIATLERRFRGIDYEHKYLEQAQVYLDANNYTEASRAVSRALILNPRNARAYYLRGLSQIEAGNRNSARADFEQAIALYQGQGDASGVSKTQGTLESLLN
ncbi:MAG: FAD-dependent oxidoreductase [Cyanobacteria bacterium P01_D01_bin.105]